MRRAAHIFAAAGCTDMTQLNEIPAAGAFQAGANGTTTFVITGTALASTSWYYWVN